MIINRKIEVELFCPMNLNKYPFHATICSIVMKIGSLRFGLKSMNYLDILYISFTKGLLFIIMVNNKIEVKYFEFDKKIEISIVVGFQIEFQRNSLNTTYLPHPGYNDQYSRR